jgi:hypothetical protein
MTMLVNGKEYKTKSIPLVVNTVDVDTAHIEKFFPAKDVQDMPHDRNWLLIIALSIVVLLLAALTYYSYRKTKENKPLRLIKKRTRRLTPHEKAMEGISLLSTDKSIEQKEYFSRLTEILRVYLEERFGIKAMEMTSGEIIEKLTATQDEKALSELRHLFLTADLVKFAKYSTLINENDMNLVNAIAFIDQTKLENVPVEETVKPQLTEEDQRSQKARRVLLAVITLLGITSALLLTYVVYTLYQLLY